MICLIKILIIIIIIKIQNELKMVDQIFTKVEEGPKNGEL